IQCNKNSTVLKTDFSHKPSKNIAFFLVLRDYIARKWRLSIISLINQNFLAELVITFLLNRF
ncbi:hypothetical protein, partial [Enterococcus durans]|uniref:hypothetical protein n=1 Tax=Enterococcus durans TaxID=53345 RepID=UPI001E562078